MDLIKSCTIYLLVLFRIRLTTSFVSEVPGLILAAFIVDRVGRKLCMTIMFVLASMLLIPLWTHQNEGVTIALLFGARALVLATFIVASIYAPEVLLFS